MRRLDHGGAYRVELDAAHDGQQVAFALHQAGLEASLPQRTEAPVPEVGSACLPPAGLPLIAHVPFFPFFRPRHPAKGLDWKMAHR